MEPSTTAHPDELVAQGREALLAGDRERARALLTTAVERDSSSEDGWMWLSGTLSDPAEMAECLHRVLALNPENQQAREGLEWLAAEYGPVPSPPVEAATPDPVVAPEIRLHPAPDQSIGALVEAALQPAAAGAFLGLLRLVSWLRPATLAQIRSTGGPLGLGTSASIAVATAALHAAALLVAWYLVGRQLSRVRGAGQGDLFDSLVRAGRIWRPGYLWGGALALAALGVGLGPRPWLAVVVLCWLLVLAGAALLGRRLWALTAELAVPAERRVTSAGRLLFSLVLAAVVALGLAGIAMAALLR